MKEITKQRKIRIDNNGYGDGGMNVYASLSKRKRRYR